MAIDWDELVLRPVMGVFGEGVEGVADQLPLYTPHQGAPFRLADAVFDREYADVTVDPDTGGEVTSRRPMLGVRLSLFPTEPKQDELVYIPSVALTFLVKDVRPDGHGHAKLMLMVTR